MLRANISSMLWSRRRRLRPAEHDAVIAFWRSYLEIPQEVRAERISPYQVTNERGRSGSSLVGVSHDETLAIIYHTHALTGEDIIHELLHVAHPDWPEETVVRETGRMVEMMSRNPKQIKSKLGYAPA